jgi:hypothetical protein
MTLELVEGTNPRWRTAMKTRSLVVVGLLAAGCGHASIPDKLLTEDPAKLDVGTKAQLGSARQELAQAKEAAGRTGGQVDEAKQELSRAQVEWKAAEARREYGEQLVEAREASEKAGRLRVEAAEAKLELAKLQALERVNPEAAAKQDRGEFYGRAASSQKDYDAALQKAQKAEAEARVKQQRWEELARKVPAKS